VTNRVVLGGIRDGEKLLQLVDEPTGMDALLTPEFVRLEVTDGRMDLSLPQLRRFKEAIAHAERVLVSRREQAVLARNLPLPLL
jgi:hypothetical protein